MGIYGISGGCYQHKLRSGFYRIYEFHRHRVIDQLRPSWSRR